MSGRAAGDATVAAMGMNDRRCPAAGAVPIGEDDQARVRMPAAAERQAYGLAADEPVVEIWRWNGTTEIHATRGTAFMFVSAEHEPDRQSRLATIARMVDDLTATVRAGRCRLRSGWSCGTKSAGPRSAELWSSCTPARPSFPCLPTPGGSLSGGR